MIRPTLCASTLLLAALAAPRSPLAAQTAANRPDAATLARTIADVIRSDPALAGPIRGSVTLYATGAEVPGLADTAGAGDATIAWRSSQPAILSATDRRLGTDLVRKGDRRGGRTMRGAPTIAILAAAPAAAASAGDRWVVPPVVASGTALPALPGHMVRWSAPGTALRGDTLVNDRDAPVTVRLTGIATRAGATAVTKRFTVSVLGRAAQRLIGYARTPTDAHDANQPIVARSLHLALGRTTAAARPLNGDYGALFAKGDYVAVDRVDLRGIADPSLFHFADGSLGVIGTRVAMDGRPAAADAGRVLVFKADRARAADFTELGTLDLGTADGVSRPQAVWDSAARRYLIGWRDRQGAPRWTTVADLARTEAVAERVFPENGGRRSRVVAGGNRGRIEAGTLATIDDPPLPIDAATAAALTHRFGRIVNTRAWVEPQTIAAGDTRSVAAARARLAYSDGSSATRAIDWNAGDLRRLAGTRRGRVTIRGTVRQPHYPRIFAYNRADPTIYRYTRGQTTRYLFIATDDTNNDNVGSVHLPIRVADSIMALSDAQGGHTREVDLLNRRTRRDVTAEGGVIAGCYWAPELHEIGGRLSILFAPCFNPDDDQSPERGIWSSVESHIMQLRDGGDPANPDDWSKPAAVRKADGSRLGRAEFARNISLDMSCFTAGGQTYYTWSQRYLPGSGPLGDPLTWIAKVDPAAPTRLTSDPRPIIAPNLAFEENLAEGGFALQRDGRVHLIYSSSGVSPTYVVGGIRADAKADLTAIDAWHKWKAPLQKSEPMPPGVTDYLRYEQGPGHGAFTTDEDGNALYVYHTWGNGVGGDGRDTRLRRIHWSADGRPVLDMTRDEEVAPANRAVTMVVTVRG